VEGGLKFARPVALLSVEVPSNEHWEVFWGRCWTWVECTKFLPSPWTVFPNRVVVTAKLAGKEDKLGI